MKDIYKLVTKTNIKTPLVLFPIIFPTIFLLMYSALIHNGKSGIEIDQLVAGFFCTALAIQTMHSGFLSYGVVFIALKRSVLLKRMGSTEMNKLDIILGIAFFGLTLWIISLIWVFLLTIFMCWIGMFYSVHNNILDDSITHVTTTGVIEWMKYISWGKLAVTTLIMLVTSYSIGLLLTTISRDEQMYLGLGFLVFIVSGFFGGIMFPSASPDWMSYIGYIVPHSYIDNLYDWANGKQVPTYEIVLGVLIPITTSVVCITLGTKLLKF